MANTGVRENINKFYDMLKISPGTVDLGRLQAMCILPMMDDILGGTMKRFALCDKKFWQKFISCCFPFLHFEKDESMIADNLYVGYHTTIPDAQAIIENGIAYELPSKAPIISPRIMGKVFFIAVPSGYTLKEVHNVDFAGDMTSEKRFGKTGVMINGKQYTLYYIKSIIPLKSTYQIILN